MTDEERKAWEELVGFTRFSNSQVERPEFLAILAADVRVKELECQKNALQQVTTELEQQIKNLEQYMLKGVAFRDELQAALTALTKERDALQMLYDHAKEHEAHDHNQRRDAEHERDEYKKLLSEQVVATNVVTKELNACYAELGIFRHPDEPDRGPDAIKRLRE